MRIGVLGSTRAARADGDPPPWLELGPRKPRAVLAALALSPGHAVDAGRLADLVWAGEPPRAALGALHAYISGLRKVLEPERTGRSPGSVLTTTDHGYMLRVDGAAVDAQAFQDTVTAAERDLAPLATQLTGGSATGSPDRAGVLRLVDALDAALSGWTGTPYADLGEHPDVEAARSGLERVRVAAEEARLLALLALGEHAGVLAETEPAVARHPWRERLWALHGLALYRAGRQGEALDALRTVRRVLADDLGLDPGTELQALERSVLAQEPGLSRILPAPARVVVAPAPVGVPPPALPRAPVGRTAERARLRAALTRAAEGVSTAAYVVGEPGIGKTRLVDDLADGARAAGFRVGVARCSQDDGAPPLWPWSAVLHDLGQELPPVDDDVAGPGRAAFAVRERITAAVLAAAAAAPVLVVVDDLHWADDASLRTLVHLLAVPARARLCVVATRRRHPEPAGAQAHVAEAFARARATRIDLGGLDRDEAVALLDVLGRPDVPGHVVDSWHDRSAGNPYFLVELARLGAEQHDEVPTSVREVVTRRLEQLPPRAQDVLRTAAVAGRSFLVETVSRAHGTDPDEVADDLEAAVAAGLLVERGDGLAFAHALTRDAVLLTLPGTRRSRRHAQVAHVLESDPVVRRLVPEAERVAETARHWLAAGPTHLDRAWRAARDAATQAAGLADHREAARLGLAAVACARRSGAAPEERYALLLATARSAAYAARWFDVVDVAVEAIALARGVGRADLVARAAATMSQYAVWTAHEWQVVLPDVVEDLRWALHHVPERDADSRCRLQLALAVELYYDAGATAERRALIDTGLALARRVDDPALLTWALRAAWLASWSPDLTRTRLGHAEEAVAAARAAGDTAGEAVALVSAATDGLELCGPQGWDDRSRAAAAIAARDRLPYVTLTIDLVELNLAAMRRDTAEVERRAARLRETAPDVAVPGADVVPAAARALAAMWDDDFAAVLPVLVSATEGIPMSWANVEGMLARAGMVDVLRRHVVERPFREPAPSWQTLSTSCFQAEAALALDDRDLAARAGRVLTPYAGRMAVAGVALAIGPVDGYLALAFVVLGRRDEARHHADEAHRLATAWDLPAYLDWLAAHRRRSRI